jgi:hypothetical protein
VRRAAAYARWVKQQNDECADPPLYSLTTIHEHLSVDFHDAVAVVESRQTLAEARAARDRRHAAAEIGPLVERAEAARLLDVRPSRMKQLAREGPTPTSDPVQSPTRRVASRGHRGATRPADASPSEISMPNAGAG